MRKFFKDNIHHVIAFFIIIATCFNMVFSTFGFDLLKDEIEKDKGYYEECLVYQDTGYYAGEYRVGTDSQTIVDDICINNIKNYKEGGTIGTNTVFSRLVSESFLERWYFVGLLLVSVSVLMFCELLKEKRKRVKFSALYRKALKTVWVGPALIICLYLSAFLVRGPLTPTITDLSFYKSLLFIVIMIMLSITYSATFINSGLFLYKKCKNKHLACILNIVIMFVYVHLTFYVMSLIYLSLYHVLEEEILVGFTMYGFDMMAYENVTIVPMLGAFLHFGITFVFAYLAYNDKLNKKFIKK